MISSEEPVGELWKNIELEDLMTSYLIQCPKELTDPEKAVKKELESLRQMRRTLNDIHNIRRKKKPQVVKHGERAKEEAMQLLRSGAISISDTRERHTFKRKLKDGDEVPPVAVSPPVKSVLKNKAPLYSNFRRGPKLIPNRFLGGQKSKEADSDVTPGDEHYSKPTFPPELDVASSNLDAAASKRKQQLLELSSDEPYTLPDPSSTSYSLESVTEPRQPYFCADNFLTSETVLHVGYHNVTPELIRDIFKQCGTIVRIKISEQQSHAYVTMETRQMAQRALQLDHQMVNNRLLRVSYARKNYGKRRGFRQSFEPFNARSQQGRGFRPPSYSDSTPFNRPTSSGRVDESSRDLVAYTDLYEAD